MTAIHWIVRTPILYFKFFVFATAPLANDEARLESRERSGVHYIYLFGHRRVWCSRPVATARCDPGTWHRGKRGRGREGAGTAPCAPPPTQPGQRRSPGTSGRGGQRPPPKGGCCGPRCRKAFCCSVPIRPPRRSPLTQPGQQLAPRREGHCGRARKSHECVTRVENTERPIITR